VNKSKHKPIKKVSAIPREKEYLNSLDLVEWWEEFATATHKNGTQKYPTVWSFIKAKAKHEWQRKFLYWILGPKAEGQSPYPDFAQYDWEAKRDRGFWYSSKNIETLKAEVKGKATSFARLQTAGDSLLDNLAELAELDKQISKEFGGRLMLPNNTADENAARMNLYLTLKEKVQTMKAHILQTYAKTQGMDLNQLSNFLELFANGMGKAVASQLGFGSPSPAQLEAENSESKYNNVLMQLHDMTLKKSADLDLALPSSEMEKVVEIAVGSKKARVQ